MNEIEALLKLMERQNSSLEARIEALELRVRELGEVPGVYKYPPVYGPVPDWKIPDWKIPPVIT
jgi:hypothetical protein